MGFISSDKLIQLSQMKAAGTFPSFEWCVFNPDGSVDAEFYPVKTSSYALQIKRWLSVFDSTQIHVVNGLELKLSPWSALRSGKFSWS